MMGTNPQWYVACTKPSSEFVARDELRNHGFTVFCPYQRITKRHRRPRTNQFVQKTRDYPFFSRYLFVRTPESSLNVVMHSRRILGVISAENQPVVVPDSVMVELFDRTNEEGQIVASAVSLLSANFHAKVGDSFKFSDQSPLQGFVGTIGSLAKLDKDGTVSAWVDMLGSMRSIEVYHTAVGRVISDSEVTAITSH